jgi:hypothetical protein
MALYLRCVVPTDLQATVIDALLSDFHGRGNHSTSGIVGQTFLFRTLRDVVGDEHLALSVLLHDAYPSFGYMLSQVRCRACLRAAAIARVAVVWARMMTCSGC